MNIVPFPSIWLLATIALASPFAMNVFNPAMPDVVRAFGSSIDTVQLTMTLYLFTLGISQLMSGALADRYGRRPLMLWGMVIHLFGCLLAAFATTIEMLILGRVLQALGGGATLVLVRTMILDAHGRDEAGRLLSFIFMSIAIALLMFRQLQETGVTLDKTPFSFRALALQYLSVLKGRAYIGYALTGALISCAYLGFASIMPYIFVDQFGGTSAEYGNWFLVVSLGFFFGSMLASRITMRFGVDRMITMGMSLALLAISVLMLVMFSGNLMAAMIFFPMGLLTFGRGLVQPNAQSGAVSSTEMSRGTASGMMGFMQLMLASGVTQLMPILLGFGIIYVFIAMVILLLMAAISHRVALAS